MTPTLPDAAGITVPDDMQGRSIMPLVRNERIDWPGEAFMQISEAQVGRAIRTERWKYCVDAPDRDTWIDGRRGATRYVEQYLYDLQADAYDRIKTELCKRLIRWMNEVGEDEPEIIPVKTHESGQHREWPSAAQDLGMCFRRPAD